MDQLDDLPLERVPAVDPTLPEPTRKGVTPLVVVAVAGLAVGAAAAWWWYQSHRAPVPGSVAAPTTGTDAALTAPPERVLPPLGQMDTFLRALLGALSSHPDVARWLATDDLIRQMANGIDRVSRGQTPARDVPMLRPAGDFEVQRSGPSTRAGRQTTIAPASFRRYDSLATLVESLDPQAVANAYHTIRPRLDEAYRGLGRAEGGVNDALTVALQLLIDTPLPTEPVRVVPGKGATYAYDDPAFESLMPVQKQLLRMGPANARRVQARLKEIKSAIAQTGQ
jgi:Protein of unknown function (DUF3014)